MANVEERVAFLEGRVDEHSQMMNGIREAIVTLEQRMDRRFEAIDRRFDGLDQRFAWLVGIQLTTLVAIIAALLARH